MRGGGKKKTPTTHTYINEGFLRKGLRGFFIFRLTLMQVVPNPTVHLQGSLQATNGRQRFSLNEATWEEDEASCQLACSCVVHIIASESKFTLCFSCMQPTVLPMTLMHE